MKRINQVLMACVSVGLANVCAAETRVSGGDLYGGTWDASGSPYILAGDVTVVDGYTLTIAPGTVVQGETSGTDLVVEGRLVAQGTEDLPILFTAVSTKWGGVKFDYADSDCVFSHCIVDKSSAAVKLMYSSFAISDCILENNHGYGLYLDDSSPWIERCKILNNGSYGLWSDVNSHPQIRNSLFANNEGLYAGAIYGFSYLELINCTFANNKATYSSSYGAVYMTSDTIVRNCLFAGNRNGTGGIRSFHTANAARRPAVRNCLVEEGYAYGTENLVGAATFKNPTTMAGGILFEPGTANGKPTDYSLQAGSLGVNVGNNSDAAYLNTDVDGNVRIHDSVVDMGCFEYLPTYAEGTSVTMERAIRLSCATETGRKYQFWWCDSSSSQDWRPLGDVITGTGDQVEMFDSLCNAGCRIYRVTDRP